MSAEKQPLVSVCVATYNRMQLLPETIASVLAQRYTNIELIIVNDCSPDDTDQLMQQLLPTDARIRYIRHETNKGLAAARNTAIFSATGKYFTFIDDDDRWTDNFISEFVTVAEQYDENWCFFCGYSREDLLGQTVHVKYAGIEDSLANIIRMGFTPPVAAQFYNTNTLQAVGGYREEVKTGVDHDLWITLAFHGVQIKSVDKYLALPSDPINVSRSKMTNVYSKRIAGLQRSFQIWKEPIVRHFGEAYYQRFVEAYMIREKKKFLRLYLLQFNLTKAYELYKELGADANTKEVLKSAMIALLHTLNIRIRREKFSTGSPSLNLSNNC